MSNSVGYGKPFFLTSDNGFVRKFSKIGNRYLYKKKYISFIHFWIDSPPHGLKIKFLFPYKWIFKLDVLWAATEYVKDIEQKEIIIFHLDIRKDKKDVVYARFLLNGMKIAIVLVAIIN